MSRPDQERIGRHSFSGADLQCVFMFHPGRGAISQDTGESFESKVTDVSSQIQTLTVSSMRTLGPVRVLGETPVRAYTRGPRTIAGSMIFSLIDDDPFARFYQVADVEQLTYQPFFVDQVPTFDVLIYGETEHLEGDVFSGTDDLGVGITFVQSEPPATAVLLDCTLANFGMTWSINDMMLEGTYTYEARGFLPWVRDPAKLIKAYRTHQNSLEVIKKASGLIPVANKRGEAIRVAARPGVTNVAELGQ